MKKPIAFVLALLFLLSLSACGGKPEETSPAETPAEQAPEEPIAPEEPEEPHIQTAEELMADMKIGWNLGNTFDAPTGETGWGQPVTTQDMIRSVHELGFNTIRIPISWGLHTSGAPDWTIDESFMNRVDTIVNYALDEGMYVIINSHHDNDFYSPTPDHRDAAVAYLSAIWAQVAEHFKDADDHLIFQAMNEPRVVGTSYEWTINTSNKACMDAVDVINDLNQTFVNAVRSTGGNNPGRWLIVSPYAATYMAVMIDRFKLPEDVTENRLIVSVHAYTPYNLCLNGDMRYTTFGLSEKSEYAKNFRSLYRRFVDKGIPVILDEMGITNKDNPEARYAWAKDFVATAKEYGMVCCWWDNGNITAGGEAFGLFQRRKLTVFEASETVYQGLMEGAEGQKTEE